MVSHDSRAELTQSGLNLIQQAISIFDADLRLAVSNRAYQQMFDLPDALTAPGTSFEATIAYLVERGEYGPQPDAQAAVRLRVEQARTFQPHYIERARPNGRIIAVEGAPLSQGGWVAVYTDITEIKSQEALLRARSEELSTQVLDHAEHLSATNRQLAATISALEEAKRVLTETESHTRQVVEMVPAHIAHIDRAHRYTFSNNQLGAVFPGAPARIVGRTGSEVLGETFERIRPHVDAALAGQPQVFETTHDPTGRRIRIALTPDRDGRGAYVLSTDVTAEVQAREALAHAGRRSLAAQMTSGLAHDFGNLLTIILGLQGRLAKAPLPRDAAEDVAATLAAAHRGAALLQRIAGMVTGAAPSPRPVDLPALMAELARLARPSLGEGVTLDLDVAVAGGELLLDPDAVQDSLLNLILNARDAMAPAAGGRITLAAREVAGWLDLTVADTGPGFSPEALARGAEPFFTTKGGGRAGSGLGLSMVYDHAKRAGGTLHLANSATGGLVRLRLPLRRIAPQLVLLVEDDPDLRTGFREMLTGMGHAVLEAGSLAEAQALGDIAGLTAVLSDLQLGDGSGAALAGLGLPLVLMTALPAGHPAREGLAAPTLTKPFSSADLGAALGAALAAAPPLSPQADGPTA